MGEAALLNHFGLPLFLEEAVIGWERRMLLRHRLAEGLSKSATAEQLGISRKTVTRWIQNGELGRDMV